jgi:hypothetical protein
MPGLLTVAGFREATIAHVSDDTIPRLPAMTSRSRPPGSSPSSHEVGPSARRDTRSC